MAAASGLALLNDEDRDPLATTTFGTGELLVAAVAEGAKTIILGLGGSATIDAGIGCAQACGFTILTCDGEPVAAGEPLCGKDIHNVLMVKHGRGEITAKVPIVGAADVDTPLYGPLGALRVFGAQKGATPAMIEQFDAQLRDLVNRTGTATQANQSGAGAAGGLGYGILSFFKGTVVNGFDLVARAARIEQRLAGVHLCFTSEGQIDDQTAYGKAVAGIARLCKQQQVPCVALVGACRGKRS